MIQRRAFIVGLIVFIVGGGGIIYAKHQDKKVKPAINLQALINPPAENLEHQWLGADAATSIHINGDRYIWLFGDTIVGRSNFPKRYPYSASAGGFIHNSVGVNYCNNGRCTKIQKYFGKGGSAIFTPPEKNNYYWVLSGAMAGKDLLLSACRLSTASKQAMGIVGTTFLLVNNPQASPNQWHVISHYNVPGTSSSKNWFTSIVRGLSGRYLYIYGEQANGSAQQMTLSRIKISDVISQNWQARKTYVGGQMPWQKGGKPAALQGLPGTSEMSVVHYQNQWFSLQAQPMLSFNIIPYHATSLSGPWVAGKPIFTAPAPWSTEKTDGKNMFFIYAPKIHPEMAQSPNQLVFTYNINVNNLVIGAKKGTAIFMRDLKDPAYAGLYIPQFILTHGNS